MKQEKGEFQEWRGEMDKKTHYVLRVVMLCLLWYF